MIIYIDSDFKCHTVNYGTMTAVETDFFDGKCSTFIECYRFVPKGMRWVGEDGTVYDGEMASPMTDWKELDAAQRAYEQQQIAAYESALTEIETALGVI